MNLKILTLSQMVSIGAAWAEGGQQHALYMSFAVLAALYPDLQEIHVQAVNQQAVSEGDVAVTALTEQIGVADSRHDSAIRTVWYVLNGSLEFLKACGLRLLQPFEQVPPDLGVIRHNERMPGFDPHHPPAGREIEDLRLAHGRYP